MQPHQPQQQQQQQEFYFPQQQPQNYPQIQQPLRLPQQNSQLNFIPQQPQPQQQTQQQPFQFLPLQQSPRLVPVQSLPNLYPVQSNFIQYPQQQQAPEFIQQGTQQFVRVQAPPPQQLQTQQLQPQNFQPQYQQPRFQQINQTQQIPNQNMYSLSSYNDPLLSYGSSYPLNNNFFQSEYLSQPYQPGNQYLNDIYQDPLTGPNHYNNLIQNAPLTQPIPLPRKANNLQSQQSNRSFDSSVKQINSPVSYDGVDGDDDRRGVLTQDEQKRQQVWDKLQKANKDIKSKNNNNNSVLSRKPPLNKTPRMPQQPPIKPSQDFIDSNINAIRHKENLGHRYPPKSYEKLQTKKAELQQQLPPGQFRSRSDTIKKPPGHLDPMQGEGDKMITLNLNSTGNNKSQSADASGQALKTIQIPINSNVWKDNDRINLDINLRLVDFLNQQGENNGSDKYENPYLVNRSLDNFGDSYQTADPLDQHIRRFENKITRSLPGSTGSLSKFKPLPPLNTINNGNKFDLGRYDGGRFGKLQHEHDQETQENGLFFVEFY